MIIAITFGAKPYLNKILPTIICVGELILIGISTF